LKNPRVRILERFFRRTRRNFAEIHPYFKKIQRRTAEKSPKRCARGVFQTSPNFLDLFWQKNWKACTILRFTVRFTAICQ